MASKPRRAGHGVHVRCHRLRHGPRGLRFLLLCSVSLLLGGCGAGRQPHSILIDVGIRQADNAARPIPYIPIYVAPKAVLDEVVASCAKDQARRLATLEEALQANAEERSVAEAKLTSAASAVSRDFNDKVPVEADLPTQRDRDPLAKLMAAGAVKSAADRGYQADHTSDIEPIKRQIVEIDARKARIQAEIDSLNATFRQRLFAKLPEDAATVYTTDSQGQVTIPSPATTAVVWAEASRTVTPWLTETYRWCLLVPDALDGNNRLVLSNHTLLARTSFPGLPASSSEAAR